ncbi:unnamed protein product [Lactuca virosa]|uniref:Uncharacterized protein n=1 Tax=Lactuca virosa TaxID=75947 RepID=A0AAU9NJX6_9ASTR|nr:unnamed protein product [Lactuca virosa]
MEDLNTLRIKKQMLLIELSAIEQKINLYEQVTTVTNVPESESLKTKAIPVQTAPGKESTNPLKADALLKSIIKETATPLPEGKTSLLVNPNPCTEGISKMTTLSPTNKSVQEFTPDYKKALNKEAERFYVIYKGPHAGVHTDWGITETFCKADKVTCKKFRNEASARLSLATYQDDTSKTNQPLLRPKIQKVKEAHRDQRFDVPIDVQQTVNYPEISFEDFRTIWKKARAACPEDLIYEKFFTTDKKTKSLFNFLEGADANLVYQAFQAGLIDNIYPSCNLQELKFFPSSMVESIKNFRKKVLKAKDNPIYIRCISSLPEWIQESTLSSYHFLEIGLSKTNREIEQSRPMEDKDLPFTEILHPNRINGLRRISEKIIEIISGSKKKINYTNSHCIITSWSYNNTSQEDLRQASMFGEKFMNNTMEVSNATHQHFCRHAEQLFEEHLCHFCESKDSETKEGPSSEDDKSSSS